MEVLTENEFKYKQSILCSVVKYHAISSGKFRFGYAYINMCDNLCMVLKRIKKGRFEYTITVVFLHDDHYSNFSIGLLGFDHLAQILEHLQFH